MGEEYGERLGLGQEDGRWEPQEACSAPEESSDYSDAGAAGRGAGAGRGNCEAGNLQRRRRRRPVWSRLEEAILARQHSIRGNSWSAIAEHLPGRSASEVKNIWHSTLRSKKLKARSLLRAYAREVQERGDSTAARLEAFRSAVKLTKGNEEIGPDPSMSELIGHGKARPLGSSDHDGEDLAGEGSPRTNPQIADSLEAKHVAKKAFPKPSPTDSSEDADAASLTSDPTSRPHIALRTDHHSFRSHQGRGRDFRPASALRGGACPAAPPPRRRAVGCEPQARRHDAKVGKHGTATNTPADQLRAQRPSLHWPTGDPGTLGLGRRDADLDITAAAASLDPHSISLQQLMLLRQQQPQQRQWPLAGMANLQLERQERTGGRAAVGNTISARGEAGGEGEARRRNAGASGAGDPRVPADEAAAAALSGAAAEELARLQTMLLFQSALERGQLGLQDAAAVPAACVPPRRPAGGLAQALAQAQVQALALAQAQASMEADEAHRLALMRHYYALQLQQGRNLEGGAAAAAAAAAAAFGGVSMDVGSASCVWQGNGPRGQQRDGTRGGVPPQAPGRRASATGTSAGTAAAATPFEEYYGERGPLSSLNPATMACLGPVAAALAASGAAPFDPYSMVAPQYLAASLEQMGALMGGGGAVERLFGAHAAAAASRAAVEAAMAAEAAAMGRLAGLRQGGVAPWEAVQDSMEVEDHGNATGPSSTDTLTAVDLRAADEAPSAGGQVRVRRAPVPPPNGEGRKRTGAKRRAEHREDADASWNAQRLTDGCAARLGGSLDNPHTQGAPGGAIAWPPLSFFGGIMGNGFGGLYGPMDQHDYALPPWGADGGAAAVFRDGSALGSFRGAAPRGLGAAADRISMPGSSERRWEVAAVQGGEDAFDRKPPRRRPQRQTLEEDPEEEHPQQQQPKQRQLQQQTQPLAPPPPQQPQQQMMMQNDKQDDQQQQQQRRRRQEQEQPQVQQQQQKQEDKGEDQRMEDQVNGEAAAVDLSICDVARALLSFSQQKPRPVASQGRGSLSGRNARPSE